MYEIGAIIMPGAINPEYGMKAKNGRRLAPNECLVVTGMRNGLLELFNFPGVNYEAYLENRPGEGINSLKLLAKEIRDNKHEVANKYSNKIDEDEYCMYKEVYLEKLYRDAGGRMYTGSLVFIKTDKPLHAKHVLERLEEF